MMQGIPPRTSAIAALGLLFALQPLMAGDEQEEAATVVTEELTVVDRAAASQTAVVREIGRDEIESVGARTAADILQFATGLHLLSSGARGGTAHAQLRGGDPNFTVVLLDGVPLNDPTGLQGGAFNLATLPADHVERVQILRGPHSYFFGSNALAGVINLTTKRGADAGEEGTARLFLEGGSHDLLRGAASLGAGGEHHDWFVGADNEASDGALGDDSYEQTSLQTRLGRQLTDRLRLRFVGRYSDSTIDDYPETSGGPTYGSGELRRSDGEVLSSAVGADLAGSDWHHTGSLTHTRLRSRVDSPAIFPLVPPSTEDRRYERTQLNWSSGHQTTDSLSVAFGGQVDREKADNESLLLLPDFFGGPVAGDYSRRRSTLGGFAEATLRKGPVTLNLGARADDPEGRDVEWSPRFGVVARLGDSDWRLRGSWSQGFKLPSFFALASPPQLGGNPGLRPETSEGVDLGLEIDRGGSALAILAFNNRYQDLIDFDFNTFQNVNRSRVEAEGVEISGRIRPRDDLSLALDWTFQDVVDLDTQQSLLNEPDWFGSLRVDWRATPALNLHLDARFSAGSLDVQLAVPELDSVDGYEVVGLGLRWQISRQFALTGRVDNLTDATWQQFIGFPQPGRSGRIGLVWQRQPDSHRVGR